MLTLEALTKVYPARKGEYAGGIRGANIELEPGTFFTLLGPSGCGKTTTLRCIAGLETPDEGKIIVDGQPLFDSEANISVPLHLRNIGMVFQSYAIWPHMSVFENVSFPMRVSKNQKYTDTEIKKAVEEALDSVGLGSYGARSATQLSGGQQQRVALARAIVHRPKLLLLDEPLSNLDAALREDMRTELKRLQRELGITAVYVTHDQTEALAMSDTIAVINKSKVVQVGSPSEIYFTPTTEFVAGFVGHTNILHATLDGAGSKGKNSVATLADGSKIQVNSAKGVGPDVAVSVRPEDISLIAGKGTKNADANSVKGTVTSASFLGNLIHYEVTSESGVNFRVEGMPSQALEPGTSVSLSFSAERAVAVARD